MLLEFLSHLLALDIGWILQLALGNIFLIFGFIAIIYFFSNGKNVLYGFVALTLTMWIWVDFQNSSGMVWTIASFVALFFLVKLSVLAISEYTPALKNNLIIISEITGIVTLLIFVAFIR
ncbi:MAG: hypothetical protein V1494_00040 [Candidatus Diapherotrites archaeon]